MRQVVKSAVIVLMLVALGVAVLPPTAIGDDALPYTRIDHDAYEADDSPWGEGHDPSAAPSLRQVSLAISIWIYCDIYDLDKVDHVQATHVLRQESDDTVQNIPTVK